MKKRISLLLAVVMVLGSFGGAFASDLATPRATTVEEEAGKFLNDKKVLLGIKGTGDLDLDGYMKRQDSVVMLSRLVDEEYTAANHRVIQEVKNFKDFKDPVYRAYISWGINKGYFIGRSKTDFGFNEHITAKDYSVVLLRALGYEIPDKAAYDKAYAEAERLGLLENVNAKEADKITRGQMSVMTVNALNTKLKDGSMTLAESLGIKMPEVEAEVRVEKFEDIKVEEGTKIEEIGLPETAKVIVGDKEVEAKVEWDTKDLSTDKLGTIVVKGLVDVKDIEEVKEDTLATEINLVVVEKEDPLKAWELVIEAPKVLKSDGQATGVVNFSLMKDGKVDTEANNVVLDLNTTYGTLSQKRVTIQNGKAQVILRSEFNENEVSAKIDAQIIEAEGIYKDLIGKIVADSVYVLFNHEGSVGEGPVVVKRLTQVNSNEADRVTLIFDEEVDMFDFYEYDKEGNIEIGENGLPKLKEGAVTISQKSKDGKDGVKTIRAIVPSETNKKAVVAILEKDSRLEDNNDVKVTAMIGNYGKADTKTFKLTDARRPNMTGIKPVDNRTVEVSFSEGISSVDLVIDGRFVEKDHFDVTLGDVDYDKLNNKFIDTRNIATVKLIEGYQEPDVDADKNLIYPAGYFKPGRHALQASNIMDFAAETDSNNIGTTQSLEFTIPEDNTATEASVVVESPEQFRITFNNKVAFNDNEALKDILKLQVAYKDKDGKVVWEELTKNVKRFPGLPENDETRGSESETPKDFLEVTEIVEGKEYKVETTVDWTVVYNTNATKNNHYNDTFRFLIEKDAVKTVANGKNNKEDIVMNLSEGTALAKPDTTSPVIMDVKEAVGEDKKTSNFVVEMSEPVKLSANNEFIEDTSGSKTLAQNQVELPKTMVEFLGKDKDGKTVTLKGEVVGYSKEDAKKTDKFVTVKWEDDNNPQEVVNAGGSEDWTIVIKAISDDIGNVAATVTKSFKLVADEKAPVDKEFKVVAGESGSAVGENPSDIKFMVEGQKGEEEDTITITFTQAVSILGIESATDVKNYTLNGDKLPTGTKIVLGTEEDNKVINDHVVVIKLPKGTLRDSNVIVLAEQIESKDGVKLSGDTKFTFKGNEVAGENQKDTNK